MIRNRTALFCAATALLAAATVPGTAAAVTTLAPREVQPCVRSPHPVDGPGSRVLETVRQAKKDLDLKSVLVRVTVDGHELVTDAFGESMTGVPAEPGMHFRAGSMAFPFMTNALLQLVEEGKVGLDDPIARWLPDAPHADRITLRMLGATTSGLHDYVTDPDFQAQLEAEPFRHWTPEELVGIAAGHPLWYKPGTNWSYSHANFVLLGAALEKITGTRLDQLLEQRVTGPLGLRDTQNNFTPDIPGPVLHAFTSERGTYEESTFWNPSWTTGPGAVITTHICDLARSAEAIGTGKLLSPSSFRTQLDPGTVGLGGPTDKCPPTACLPDFNTESNHFGLGLIVANDWIVENPSFSGYAAIEAYYPEQRVAIAVATTENCDTPDGNTAEVIAKQVSAVLVPDHPLK
ncbi:beta-lactamase family protein [Kitasatospora sp. NBC_01287]|uniref:serine hydrolase domain-containing protein n=1 Tax=Kitasatospora sp. NBC_01287 TaxID=2903573 RepID=UPI0022568FEF|nr:serine hydrolase domain-containing protein [Kitasatospora sp. NBC_01287]MCX4749757.1 beta-lactamase family protein [Kitasatospora sp. NBC_01287]